MELGDCRWNRCAKCPIRLLDFETQKRAAAAICVVEERQEQVGELPPLEITQISRGHLRDGWYLKAGTAVMNAIALRKSAGCAVKDY